MSNAEAGKQIAAILEYPVFELRPDGLPASKFVHGNEHQRATTDPDEIDRRAWRAGIGAATGHQRRDGTYGFAIDVDTKHGGVIPDFVPRNTPTVGTKSGGFHFHLRTDEPRKNSVSRLAVGVDERFTSGFVRMPPTAGYTWLTAIDTPVAFVPAELLVFTADAPGTGSRGGIDRKSPEQVVYGEIHQQLLSWVGWLECNEFTEMDAEEFLRAYVARIPGVSRWLGSTLADAKKCLDWVYRKAEKEAA